jgi:hypothetical protein
MELALSSAVKTELLPEKFSGTNYSENKQLKDLIEDANKLNRLIDSNKTFWNFLFEGKTKGELVTYRRRIRDIDLPSRNWTIVQRNREFFWALSEGCHWLLKEMENFKDKNQSLKAKNPEIVNS